ncbi:DNA-binding protein [Prevotella copri]|uniref:DNA-binding protein n=1 Tax=Segatella copri TaxID=165179 RepID=A0AA90ZMT8_9BACT|nr:HU family DNA-binding protein [Segatella copri]MQN13999.1 DNA-binding protein [Segatella copri]
MSKSYKVAKKTINMGDKKGQTVYSVRPYSYGTLTTEEVANQIAVESTATPADVKAVLDRYAYYVKENLKKGYDIELLGFGKLFIRFITGKAVEDESKANAKLVKSLVPAFRPSFTKLQNGSRIYNLLPTSIELVKYGDEKKDNPTGGTNDEEKKPTTGDSTNGGENAGGENTGGENTGGSENTGGTGSESGDNVNF